MEPLHNATFLEPSIRVLTLISTVHAALLGRLRQYEVRDLLAERERTAAELAEAHRRKDLFTGRARP